MHQPEALQWAAFALLTLAGLFTALLCCVGVIYAVQLRNAPAVEYTLPVTSDQYGMQPRSPQKIAGLSA